jgi:hypothetical protein
MPCMPRGTRSQVRVTVTYEDGRTSTTERALRISAVVDGGA